MKLKLEGFHLHPYQTEVACAYIYYQFKNQLVDQDKHPIGIAMTDERLQCLDKHINTIILPAISQILPSPYVCVGTDCINNAPHPALLIARTDKKALDAKDLKEIHEILIAKVHRISAVDPVNLKKNSMFAKNDAPHTTENQLPTHNYNLRKRL